MHTHDDTRVTCRPIQYRLGVDNGLITRELRKLFSQELDWSPVELHGDGTVKQLTAGASTGMNPKGFLDIVEFAQDDIKDRLGLDVEIPVDRQGADILIMHNAGEFLSWPENLQAFAIVAGLTALPRQPLWRDSVSGPPMGRAALALRPWLPAALTQRLRYH